MDGEAGGGSSSFFAIAPPSAVSSFLVDDDGGGDGVAAVARTEFETTGETEMSTSLLFFHYNYLPTSQYYWYFFLQVFSACLSMIGSMTIIYLIMIHRKQRWEVYHRILLSLSVADVLFDWSILFQFPLVRADTHHPLAIGNITTCTFIGFATTWTFSSVNLFFVVLSLYFVLTVRYGQKEYQVQRYIEPYGYVFAIGLPLVLCVAAVATEAFNPVRIIPTCFMRPYPTNCYNDDDNDTMATPCQRGGNARPVVLVFKTTALLTMLIGIVATWLVYWTVRQQQQRQRRHSFSAHSIHARYLQTRHRQRLRTVAQQAIWYTAVFLNGIFASMFSSRLEALVAPGVVIGGPADEKLRNNWILAIFVSLYLVLCPLQGMLNMIIYLRPCYLLWRETYPHQSRWWSVRQILQGRNVTVTRRKSHLVDGNVNEQAKCDDDDDDGHGVDTTPTLRTRDDDKEVEEVRDCCDDDTLDDCFPQSHTQLVNNSTSRNMEESSKWQLNQNENHNKEWDGPPPPLPTPRRGDTAFGTTATDVATEAAARPLHDDDDDTNNDIDRNIIGQQQQQGGGPVVPSADVPSLQRKETHGLRVSFADEQQQLDNEATLQQKNTNFHDDEDVTPAAAAVCTTTTGIGSGR